MMLATAQKFTSASYPELQLMKAVFWFLLSTITFTSSGQSFTYDKTLSEVRFSIKNFGIRTEGEFHNLDGKFVLNEETVSASRFEASVDAATVNTSIRLRDKHLREKDFLDVTHYPTIRISSNRISRTEEGWSCLAMITLKNVSRESSIDFTIEKEGSYTVFTSEFTLNRLDFGIGESSLTLSNEVIIRLRVVGTSITD